MEYRILGPLEVRDDGRQIPLGGAKPRAVLAVLLLHMDEVVSRARLVDELWGDAPPETATSALQVHVSQLRKTLGRDAIETRPGGYVVHASGGMLDAALFDELVRRAHGVSAEESAVLLRDALGLWRGAALADLDADIARGERAHLDARRLEALELRIDADLALGATAGLVPELEALVSEHPLRERFRAQLMLALYRSGRQAEALDAYRAGRKLLADELGLEPGDELKALERAILEHDPAIGSPPPTSAGRVATTAGRRRRVLAIVGAVLLALAATAAVVDSRATGQSAVEVAPESVAVVDPVSGRAVADVAVGGRPIAVAAGAGAIWVVNGDKGTLVRIDPRTLSTDQIGLRADVSDVTVAGGSVWVAGGNSGTLFRLDPKTYRGGVPEQTLWPDGADATVATPVFFVASSPNGGLWASRGQGIVRIDPASGRVVARVAVPEGVSGLAVGGGSAWVATYDKKVLRIDARSGNRTGDRVLPDLPESAVFAAGSLWLLQFVGGGPDARAPGAIWRLDADTLELRDMRTIPSLDDGTSFPVALAAGDGAVWVVDKFAAVAWKVDPKTGDLTSAGKDLAYEPISVAAHGGRLWVGVQESD